jgi:hypothetical protein
MSTAVSTKPVAGTIAVARTAPRRRSVLQGALAVLLIVAGALTAGYVALRIGSTHDFLAVGRPVAARATITAADLVVVRVNEAVGLEPIAASKINSVIGKRAVMALVPGTLLTPKQLTATPVPGPGNQLIGLGLADDQMPKSRLRAGVAVLLVVLPETGSSANANAVSSDLVPPRTIVATVIDIAAATRGSQTLVNVEVAAVDAPTVATLAAKNRIIIVLAGD